jgi:uncharacterized protein
MKVVLDTNVLISAFKDEYSYEKRIINEVIAGHVEAYANRQTIQENRLILLRLLDNPELRQELDGFFSQVNLVTNRHMINIVRDPEDNKILESAVEAEADYLVTSDSDLLEVGSYQNVQIVRPAEFWVKYKDEGLDKWNAWADFMFKK